MVCTRLRQGCRFRLKEFNLQVEEFNLQVEELNLQVEADICNLAVACREFSDAQAAEASEDQEEEEEDLMDIQADHQVALIVLSEAASLSPGVDLQAEAARPHHHLTEDLQQQHRPRQADHLQESRETRAWRLRWPS